MSKVAELVILNKAQVSKCMPTFGELFDSLKNVMIDFSSKNVLQPLRTTINLPDGGRFISMPACLLKHNVMGVKTVSAIPSNVKLNIPTHLANIQLYKLTGELFCQMDGEEITAKRTAATSAIATSLLADKNSKHLAIIGAGVQARSHILALQELYQFSSIRIWNHRYEKAIELASELDCVACEDIEEACLDADIICTVTSSTLPHIEKSHVKPGAHINVVGGTSPQTRQVEDSLMLSDNLVVVCDCYEGAMAESGDLIQTGVKPHHELGELLADNKFVHDPQSITLFKNNGLACQDVITAKLLYKRFIDC